MMTSRKKRKKRVEWLGQHLPLFDICLWLVILLVGGLLQSVDGGEVPGSITTTAYPSGVTCGIILPVKCLAQSSCSLLGRCQCPAPTHGDGDFNCYPANSIRAEISSNVIKSFRKTIGKVYWPCRFRFTEFTTVRKQHDGQKCNFQVFGVNQIFGGKVILSGYDVHIQTFKGSKQIAGLAIRKDGKAQNHVFTYTERGKNVFVKELPVTDERTDSTDDLSDGSGSGNGWNDDDDTNDDREWGPSGDLYLGEGERVVCKVDLDNFATVDVPSCGTTIRFRAASVDVTQQATISGLSVTISEDNEPIVFNSPGSYLAETKLSDILTIGALQKNINLELAILHQVMTNAAKQYSTPEGNECDDTARTYRSYCKSESEQARALETCFIFLGDSSLTSCLDPSRGSASSNSLKAFKLCVWNSCKPSRGLCSLLHSRVQLNGCMHLIPLSFPARNCNA